MSWGSLANNRPQTARVCIEIESLSAECDPLEFIEELESIKAFCEFRINSARKKLERVV